MAGWKTVNWIQNTISFDRSDFTEKTTCVKNRVNKFVRSASPRPSKSKYWRNEQRETGGSFPKNIIDQRRAQPPSWIFFFFASFPPVFDRDYVTAPLSLFPP